MDTNILQGKTALITGASSGLGTDFARDLASYGCNLILVARREDRLQTLQKEIKEQYGVDVSIIPLDLLTHNAPQYLYDQIILSGKTVDVLINNAGFGVYGQFINIPLQRQNDMLQLDIIVPVQLTKLFIKDMIERDFGYILLVSSTGAYQATPNYSAYAAAKSFVLNFGEALNYEIKRTNVKCTVVSPGYTETEFLQVAGQRPTLYHRLLAMQSEEVTRIGINAMLKGKPSVISGRLNAISAWTIRFLPRRLSTAIAHHVIK